MLHHRTEDPGVRAGHIAEREAALIWRRTNGNGEIEFSTWRTVYVEALREFASFSLPDDVITTAQ